LAAVCSKCVMRFLLLLTSHSSFPSVTLSPIFRHFPQDFFPFSSLPHVLLCLVDKLTSIKAGQLTNFLSIHVICRKYFTPKRPGRPWDPTSILLLYKGALSAGAKRPVRDTDHLHLPVSEVKNERI
jgi:hypothetical protein